ncbi:monovalent cation/H+ antiporter subunit D family protein [Actinocorallia populi]|uniref:monovalent cation/H+ antiporter subunit D family protein n=1 Tax=Actinocorallia populi TaxID=2079200 RepID=UPI000D08E7A0|nr:monovalent cation/H+ antiporter subunit D family protein [Actinocorallia populi]
MSGVVLVLPVAVPLLAAGLLSLLPGKWPHRLVGAGVNAGVLLVGGVLLVRGLDGGIPTERIGGWPAGFAIVLAADPFSALMVCASAVLVTAALCFAAVCGQDGDRRFTPLVLVLAAGVYGALLTADLFNFFVFVEVMLVPSYVLLVLGSGRDAAAGRIYVTVGLLASSVFLAGVALVYGVAGTVNLGELAGAAERGPAFALAGAVVLLGMAVKAAVVPFHGWLPRTYPRAPAAVSVLFAGLLTKVGVYAIIRIYAVFFGGAPQFRWVVMAAALLTMAVGVLGALGERTMRDVLSFDLVSQIGYALFGLALFTGLGLTAAVFFMVQYVLVKTVLFMCAGAVEHVYGSDRLDLLGGLLRKEPLLAGVFLVAALSLAGIPPLSGFVAKLGLLRAAVAEEEYLPAAVAVVTSLLTLAAMLKVWSRVFWSRPSPVSALPGWAGPRPVLLAPAVVLAVPSVAFGLGAEPLWRVAETAAGGLLDVSAYVRAVTR